MTPKWTLEQLAEICGGTLIGNGQLTFTAITQDTRRPGFPAETLFVALPGAGRSGIDFMKEYYHRGCRAFLVQETIPHFEQLFPGAGMVLVPDSVAALQHMAASHRRAFGIPVVGITGSNGKTVVKEWLYQCLAPLFRVVRSPGSYNSQIGVPLSVLLMTGQHEIALFEAGISLRGEMDQLAQMIVPTIGVLTNLGTAHDEGFSSPAEKLAEKCKLFAQAGLILARSREVRSGDWPSHLLPNTRSWGEENDNYFCVTKEVLHHQKGTAIGVKEAGEEVWNFHLPFSDAASVENGITTALALRLVGLQPADIDTALMAIHPIDMRLSMVDGINGCKLINDSYSHDEVAFRVALNYWREQAGERRSIIISDPGDPMAELSPLLRLLQQQDLYRLVAIGPRLSQNKSLAGLAGQVHQFADTAAAMEAFDSLAFAGETILIKGARRFGFEALAAMLTENMHQTVLQIDLEIIRQNLAYYRSMLKPGTRLMVMVKAFGYGSGDAALARLLENSGVDYLAVAYPNEGIALRKAGIRLPILVLNADTTSFGILLKWNLEPELFSLDILEEFVQYAEDQGIVNYPVHLKLDTGMHRLGFLPEETAELAGSLNQTDAIRVKSVFSHLKASENPDADQVTRAQLSLFSRLADELEAETGLKLWRHIANSHAIARFPEAHLDMVRLGIGLFGKTAGSHGALELFTTVAQVKQVKAGASVGYGLEGIMPVDGQVAIVRIGYADGLPRQLGNGRWRMRVHNRLVPTIGHICMDMTMLDVTGVDGVRAGDRVEVFGNTLPISQLAKEAGTISYDIMTGIAARVPRRYLHG